MVANLASRIDDTILADPNTRSPDGTTLISEPRNSLEAFATIGTVDILYNILLDKKNTIYYFYL